MTEAAAAQTTLRDTLAEQFDALDGATDAGTTTTQTQTHQEATGETEAQAQQRARDEAGRFAKKPETAGDTQQPAAPEVKARPPRPTSWKKDYEAHWETLDPSLAEYIHQRESEYAKGVSTYKAEADRARELNEALAPFLPDLQAHNLAPKQWLQNLGNAHKTLAMGTPEQKVQMFARLAQDYGVDLGQFTGQQQDPRLMQMAQELADLKNQLGGVKTTFEQREQQELMSHINAFAADTEKHPHYEKVKDTMAELLRAGLAPDLETAYAKAIRLNDEAWQAEQARTQQATAAEHQKAVSAARSRAVSAKTATPSGAVTTGAKDRRSILAEQLDAAATGRI